MSIFSDFSNYVEKGFAKIWNPQENVSEKTKRQVHLNKFNIIALGEKNNIRLVTKNINRQSETTYQTQAHISGNNHHQQLFILELNKIVFNIEDLESTAFLMTEQPQGYPFKELFEVLNLALEEQKPKPNNKLLELIRNILNSKLTPKQYIAKQIRMMLDRPNKNLVLENRMRDKKNITTYTLKDIKEDRLKFVQNMANLQHLSTRHLLQSFNVIEDAKKKGYSDFILNDLGRIFSKNRQGSPWRLYKNIRSTMKHPNQAPSLRQYSVSLNTVRNNMKNRTRKLIASPTTLSTKSTIHSSSETSNSFSNRVNNSDKNYHQRLILLKLNKAKFNPMALNKIALLLAKKSSDYPFDELYTIILSAKNQLGLQSSSKLLNLISNILNSRYTPKVYIAKQMRMILDRPNRNLIAENIKRNRKNATIYTSNDIKKDYKTFYTNMSNMQHLPIDDLLQSLKVIKDAKRKGFSDYMLVDLSTKIIANKTASPRQLFNNILAAIKKINHPPSLRQYTALISTVRSDLRNGNQEEMTTGTTQASKAATYASSQPNPLKMTATANIKAKKINNQLFTKTNLALANIKKTRNKQFILITRNNNGKINGYEGISLARATQLVNVALKNKS
jgi:hypothetical protein